MTMGVVNANLTLTQLADPDIAEADKILCACVHYGFCGDLSHLCAAGRQLTAAGRIY
jgi:hypothetical protein